LENGRAVPTIETLEKLCDALEIPLYQLLYDGSQPMQRFGAVGADGLNGTGGMPLTGWRRFSGNFVNT